MSHLFFIDPFSKKQPRSSPQVICGLTNLLFSNYDHTSINKYNTKKKKKDFYPVKSYDFDQHNVIQVIDTSTLNYLV